MVGFRSAKGRNLEWLPTGIQTGFSNFRFIDEGFHSSPVLRRLFSRARKLGYESLVIEEIDEPACELFREESAALAIRESRFQKSSVFRLLFLKCPPNSVLEPDESVLPEADISQRLMADGSNDSRPSPMRIFWFFARS